jgi:DNA-binding beta-propeller fold protein YncE
MLPAVDPGGRRVSVAIAAAVTMTLTCAVAWSVGGRPARSAPVGTHGAAAPFDGPVLYVVTPGSLAAYEIGGSWSLRTQVTLPFTDPVRGIDMDPSRRALYVSHGGTGGKQGNGSLLRYNVVTGRVVWDRRYPFGTDQLAYCDGRIYMPVGQDTGPATWKVLNADSGKVTGHIQGGAGPHNTICHDGQVYMGGLHATYLFTKGSTARKVGPSPSTHVGVRPFSVDAHDTRVYLTWSHFRGFSVGDLTTGQILSTIDLGPVPADFPNDATSHGISLSPDGEEIYVLDKPAQQVEVWSAGDAPSWLATIDLLTPIEGTYPSCTKACGREGWLLHSLDGHYVFVGDSGDVIDTATRSIVAFLPALQNTRHGYLEVDWSAGVPAATTTHFGIGR